MLNCLKFVLIGLWSITNSDIGVPTALKIIVILTLVLVIAQLTNRHLGRVAGLEGGT